MKLATAIQPRKDGTVTLTGLDGQPYVFSKHEASGELVADIEHEGTLAHLLAMDNFYPLDEADYDAANALVQSQATAGDEDEPDDLDDEGDPNAPPVEANTPPKAKATPKTPKPKADPKAPKQ